eukprot:TRINITY_DN2938_c0_g1_i2.p1 TRINITY_DN2938_c0_g1~~TRINITY_DN2938_c0_g1_i2.p1  ORF type:complete len:269 (+),score=47.00 TRINITY_DN2938_c0_g1_i2:678-1484(+)
MENKSFASDAVKLLDQVALVILMDNKLDTEFYESVTNELRSRSVIAEKMLKSDSLASALAGIKLIQTLLKHKISSVFEDGLILCLDLMKKFKWSNILHGVVKDILVSIFLVNDTQLINLLLDKGNLTGFISSSFSSEEKVGYLGHLRILANVMKECSDPDVIEKLHDDPVWIEFLSKLEDLNNLNTTYRQAETKRQEMMLRDSVGKVTTVSLSGGSELGRASLSFSPAPIKEHETQASSWAENNNDNKSNDNDNKKDENNNENGGSSS